MIAGSQPVSAPQTDFSSPSALRVVERRQARCLGPHVTLKQLDEGGCVYLLAAAQSGVWIVRTVDD
jgi:hypothetical protein